MTTEKAILYLENMKWLKGYDNTTIDGTHLGVIIDNIIALLREREPRVLTLDEVRQDGKACFIETRHNNHLHPAFFNDFFRNDETTVFLMTIGDLPFRNDGYGKWWRCWSARPTEEQQREVKWDD